MVRETQTPVVTLPAGVTVSLEKLVIFFTFNDIFCNTGGVVFFCTMNFFLIQYFEETLPPLLPQRKRPCLYTHMTVHTRERPFHASSVLGSHIKYI